MERDIQTNSRVNGKGRFVIIFYLNIKTKQLYCSKVVNIYAPKSCCFLSANGL